MSEEAVKNWKIAAEAFIGSAEELGGRCALVPRDIFHFIAVACECLGAVKSDPRFIEMFDVHHAERNVAVLKNVLENTEHPDGLQEGELKVEAQLAVIHHAWTSIGNAIQDVCSSMNYLASKIGGPQLPATDDVLAAARKFEAAIQ